VRGLGLLGRIHLSRRQCRFSLSAGYQQHQPSHQSEQHQTGKPSHRQTHYRLPVNLVGSITQTTSGTVTSISAGTNAIGDVGIQYRGSSTGAASGSHLVSAATTNATVVKAGAGRVVGWSLANTNAAWRYVKLHNQTTTPTAGTAVARTIAIPPNGRAELELQGGIGFGTGIGFTCVTGAADSDATAVGLNDIVGDIFFA